MFVDAVIRHWVTVVGGPEEGAGRKGAGREGLGTSTQTRSGIFYADDEIVASLDIAHLQGGFDAFTGLFDRVGLRTNEGKTVIMAYRPCHNPHAWSTEAYTHLVTGRGVLYRDRLQ